jgi:hypothetical protein
MESEVIVIDGDDDDDDGEWCGGGGGDEESNQKELQRRVIKLSESDLWTEAKTEWILLYIYDKENHCACGHRIYENCVIKNVKTEAKLIVGNVCINQFKEDELHVEPSARQSLKKLIDDPGNTFANAHLLSVALRTGILSKAEHTEYSKKTTGPGKLNRYNPSKYDGGTQNEQYNTERLFRAKINGLIVLGFSAQRPECTCGLYTKPRQNSHNKSFFYSCVLWPNGCDFTQNAPRLV